MIRDRMWEKRHFQGRDIKKMCTVQSAEETYELGFPFLPVKSMRAVLSLEKVY